MLINKPIKAVFFDLDGTLLNSKKRVGPRTKCAISRAMQSGIYVSIASGRCYPTIMAIAGELRLNGPIVTTNGAQIIDPASGQPLWESSLPPDRLIPVLKALDGLGVTFSALGYDCCLYSGEDSFGVYDDYSVYARGLGYPVTPIERFAPDFSNVAEYHVAKVLVGENNAGDCKRAMAYVKDHFDFDLYFSSPVLLEIMPRGIDKGTGVVHAAELVGAASDEVAVFGDYDNDLSMFAAVGLPIAMGNARANVKSAAAYVCGDNDSDGIADALDLIISENAILKSK